MFRTVRHSCSDLGADGEAGRNEEGEDGEEGEYVGAVEGEGRGGRGRGEREGEEEGMDGRRELTGHEFDDGGGLVVKGRLKDEFGGDGGGSLESLKSRSAEHVMVRWELGDPVSSTSSTPASPRIESRASSKYLPFFLSLQGGRRRGSRESMQRAR